MSIRIFNSYIRLQVLILIAIEATAVVVATYLGIQLCEWYLLSEFDWVHGRFYMKASVVTGVVLLSLVSMGLYQFHQRIGFNETLARLLVGLFFSGIGLSVTYFVIPVTRLSPIQATLVGFIAFLLIAVVRYVFLRSVDENALRKKTLVYGTGSNANSFSKLRRRADRRGFKVIGYVPTESDDVVVSEGELIRDELSLLEIARKYDIDEIVVAPDDRRDNLPIRDLLDCKLRGVEVFDLMAFLERETSKIRIDLLTPAWFIFSEGFKINRFHRIIKRTLDVFTSVLALFLVLPIIVLTAIVIFVDSGFRGPVLYRQVRVGLHGDSITVLKFRSMRIDAEADGKARWAEKDDDRITRVGKFLRKTRIDELPQIFNVLRGQMSIVGPRPERPEFVEQLSQSIPYYHERHSLKPGITGWAQLRYPYGSSEHDALEKLQYDLYYIKNHSLLLDLVIMLQTAEVVLWGRGAR